MALTIYTLVLEDDGDGTDIRNFLTERERDAVALKWLGKKCGANKNYTGFDDLVEAYDVWQSTQPHHMAFMYWEDTVFDGDYMPPDVPPEGATHKEVCTAHGYWTRTRYYGENGKFIGTYDDLLDADCDYEINNEGREPI